MKIFRKITLIMGSLPLVVSQVSAMDKNPREIQQGPTATRCNIFPSCSHDHNEAATIYLDLEAHKKHYKISSYPYYEHNVMKNGTRTYLKCYTCGNKIKDKCYFTIPDKLPGANLCESCALNDRFYQCATLIGSRLPLYDAERLNGLISDESLLSTLPIVITGDNQCGKCAMKDLNLSLGKYSCCSACGLKMCSACGPKQGEAHGTCPSCGKETLFQTDPSKLRGEILISALQAIYKLIYAESQKHAEFPRCVCYFPKLYYSLLRYSRDQMENSKKSTDLRAGEKDGTSKSNPNK